MVWVGLALAACSIPRVDTPPPTAADTLTATLALPEATATPPPTATGAPSPTADAETGQAPSIVTEPPPAAASESAGGLKASPLLVAADASTAFKTHFLMSRPFDPAMEYQSWASRNYPYGSTADGAYQVHHGVDIMNPAGTPVRAVAPGKVFYAGTDRETQFGPRLNFYGNLVMIEHDITVDGQTVYSLYGHLSGDNVYTGQDIVPYHQIGLVGSTGVAIGAHLHFEVRVGDPYDYFAVRNPDLWLQNFRDFGVLAGRVVDAQGEPVPDVAVELNSPDAAVRRSLTTYADLDLPSDDALNENFAIGDLPVAVYDITIKHDKGTYKNQITIYPDRVTWLSVTLP